MQSSSIPSKVQIPFANTGGKNTIPVASQTSTNAGGASFADGFPIATRTPLAAGGVPPSGQDMNGILNYITAIQQWQSAGGLFKFDGTFASAISGYPKGAALLSTNNLTLWRNYAEANSTDPDGASPANWIADQGGLSAVSAPTSSMTLTLGQLGSLIIFNGSTASQSLSLPAVASVPAGKGYWIQNVASVPVTIKGNGSEQIVTTGIGIGAKTANALVLGIGESTFIVSNQASWYEQQGVRAGSIAGVNLLAANGYRTNADGSIEQWGSLNSNSSGTATITYPIAFPNAVYTGYVTTASGGIYYGVDFDAALGLSSVTIRLSSNVQQLVYYRVFGK